MTPDQFSMLVRVDAGVQVLVESKVDHEARLRSLEASRYRQVGAMGVLSILISGVWQWLMGGK